MKNEHHELLQRLEDYTPDEATAFPFSQRLARENSWPLPYTHRVILEYKRFAFLAVAAGHPVAPSDEVDQAWHLHMLYTGSYWKSFCGKVLRQPLHHQPTKGGASEHDKFHDWYQRTIESYRRFFNEEPPADIWPEASHRFGSDTHFVRVNIARNWIIPKPAPFEALKSWSAVLRAKLAWRWSWSATATVMAVGGAGCGTMVGTSVSPFDLPGSDFIRFFILLWMVNLGLAAWLRWTLRQPHEETGVKGAELDPYAVAYLAGGEDQTVNAAIANLVHVGVLKADATTPRLLRESPLPPVTHPFEEAVYDKVAALGGSNIAGIRQQTGSQLSAIEEQLRRLGLLVSRSQSAKAVCYPLFLALLVSALGVVKISVGLSRAKPVGFLIFLCMVSVLVALGAFARRPRRSRRGDQVLAGLKERHAGLQKSWANNSADVAANVLPLAIGLFGLTALAATPLADLQKTLRKPAGSDGCGGGCGGGGCGGGGCGGGCGG